MFNMSPSLLASHKGPLTQSNDSGFNFGNCLRNRAMVRGGLEMPEPLKSGTTVAGIMYANGVVIGTDTRSTAGKLIESQKSEKIYRLHDFIFAGGAGAACDIKKMASMIETQMGLVSMNTNRRHPPVCCANRLIKQYLYRFRGALRASFIVGGVGLGGSQLYCTHSDGSSDRVPYTALGSGALPAMGVLETRWHAELEEKAARDLVCDAVVAGIDNDLYSGSSVNLCIIRCDYSLLLCKQPVYFSRNINRVPLKVRFAGFGLRSNIDPNYEVVETRVYPLTLQSSDANVFQSWTSTCFEPQAITAPKPHAEDIESDDEDYSHLLLDNKNNQLNDADLNVPTVSTPQRANSIDEPVSKKLRRQH